MKRSSHLKKIFSEIIRGYSLSKIDNELVYVKHPSAVDSAELEFKYDEFFSEAIKNEIPTAEEREKYLLDVGLWTQQKNSEILTWKEFIKSLNVTKTKVLIKRDIDSINEQIKDGERTLTTLEIEKGQLIGFTAENYATQKFNDCLICNSIFKDNQFKQKFFQDDDFNEIDDKSMERFLECYYSVASTLQEKTLKKVAVQPFFQNSFNLCENNCFRYYGKAVIDLTIHQVNLFSLGVYYQNALKEYGGEINEEITNDPDSFVEKVIQKKNVDRVLDENPNATAQSIVGMTSEDMKRAGITKSETISMSKFVGKTFEEIARDF